MAMKNKDFAVFILTHGRADNVLTDKTLRKCGYTGDIYYIVDDDDPDVARYVTNFGSERVKIFSKDEIEQKIDTGDNFGNQNTITHARNACFDIAEEVGITYFIQLDDDYSAFSYRKDNNSRHISDKQIKNLDKIFDSMLRLYRSIPVLTLAMAQNGDFVGGKKGKAAQRVTKRKAMNSFICSTDRRFWFRGTMNEDVNTYCSLGSRGNLFFTIFAVSLAQKETQSQAGGITGLYLDMGTYVKSFYTVMYQPSSVKVMPMYGAKHQRIHHRIEWNSTVPKIVSEDLKK